MALGLATLALAACTAPMLQKVLREDPELKAVLDAYRKEAERAASAPVPGVRLFEVVPGATQTEVLVSVDLDQAPLGPVVMRVLTEARLPYLVDPPVLPGRVTARFERVPMIRALNIMLERQGLGAAPRDGVIVIGGDVEPPAAADPAALDPKRVVTANIALNHLDKDTVSALLQGVAQRDPSQDDAGLRFSAQPYTNTVLLVGSAANVHRAARLLRQADQDPEHVVIEALVVEIDANALESLGTDLTGFTNEQFRSLSTSIGTPGAAALTFRYLENFAPGAPSSNRAREYTATIDLLVQRGKARVIARPHLSAVSGRKARIEISEDRYVVVQEPAAGATVTATRPVQSGVILDITPHITRAGRVRMGVVVEQSAFIPESSRDITASVDKNKAETTMEVVSGQSILIGGLTQHTRSATTAGLPWLRHIPLLNLAFAKFQSDARRQEVQVFITPRIWRPGMDSPIPEPKAFTPQEPRDDFSSIERFNR